MNNNIYFRIKRYIEENKLIQNGDKIVVGLSGGADSVFLFVMLCELSKEYDIEVTAVHINHGIRGKEALRDEEYAVELAGSYGRECRVFRADIPELARKEKLTEEEAGRRYRYDSFERVRNELSYNKIAVAHHMDDQAETLLFQLMRGSSLRGMGGMRPVNGNIIRPLLAVRRCEIEQFLEERGITFCTDSTNEADEYSRNKLRHNVIPYLEKDMGFAAVEHMAKTAAQLRDVSDYVSKMAYNAYADMTQENPGECIISLEKFVTQDIVIQREVVMMAMEHVACRRKDITTNHVEAFISLFYGDTGKRLNLPYDMTAGRDYNDIWLRKCDCKSDTISKEASIPVNFSEKIELAYTDGKKHIITSEKKKLSEREKIIVKNSCTKWFDYDKIKTMLEFRYPREGDYLLMNAEGSKKKLNRLMIDQKIPKDYRDKMWVLAEGSHVLWIPEMGRTSVYYYITDKTTEVIGMTLEKN